MTRVLGMLSFVLILAVHAVADDATSLKIATFRADITPPLGSPLCFGYVEPAKEIVDPLTARGIVILGAGKPIVLCSLDWVEIMNASHDAWREALATAAGTSTDRVAVHTIHQHDAPGSDFGAEELLAQVGIPGVIEDIAFNRDCIVRTAEALSESLKQSKTVTHVGIGSAAVEKVASNRRILGPDGKVKIIRFSSTKDPDAIAAPEGTIDPLVRLVSFWNGDKPLAVLSHYATHPQSFYGQGGVSADFVGMARTIFEKSIPDAAAIHFNGAAGNVAAGKYNNGEPATRPILAERLARGMKSAWGATKKAPVSTADIRWGTRPVALPLRDTHTDEKSRIELLNNDGAQKRERARSALDLSFALRTKRGHKIPIHMLKVGPAHILYLPGELFVEYQLAAQQLRPDDFVAMAAYGDCGPGYIGTEIAYGQGGYETSAVSRTAPQVEGVLMGAIRELLAGE
ncbi:MAG: hypothetical protein AB7O26_10410 [Planctomycetaceae bacterium]